MASVHVTKITKILAENMLQNWAPDAYQRYIVKGISVKPGIKGDGKLPDLPAEKRTHTLQ